MGNHWLSNDIALVHNLSIRYEREHRNSHHSQGHHAHHSGHMDFFFKLKKTIEIQLVRPSEVKYKVMVKYKVGKMAKWL